MPLIAAHKLDLDSGSVQIYNAIKEQSMQNRCQFAGCQKLSHARGYCATHARRIRIHGDVNKVLRRVEQGSKYIKLNECIAAMLLTRGYITILDVEDIERITQYNWYSVGDKKEERIRAARNDNSRKMIFLHHEILRISAERLKELNREVDHIDRDPLNNMKSNLRIVTHSENMYNREISIYRKGYCFNKRANLWVAYLDIPNQKRKYLGYRKTKEEVLILLDLARQEANNIVKAINTDEIGL